MGEKYLEACRQSMEEVEMLVDRFKDDYTIIFTADHGGHERIHGTREESDMRLPLIFIGPDFTPGPMDHTPFITAISPTIPKLIDAASAPEWEGYSMI